MKGSVREMVKPFRCYCEQSCSCSRLQTGERLPEEDLRLFD